MNQKRIIELVEQATADAGEQPVNLFDFANKVADAQREDAAKLFEDLGLPDVALKIKNS